MKAFLIIFCFVTFPLFSFSQDWKKIDKSYLIFSPDNEVQKSFFRNGNIKNSGEFNKVYSKTHQLKEFYFPVGEHFTYYRNGNIKRYQEYNNLGFMLLDSLFKRKGRIRMVRKFLKTYSEYLASTSEVYILDKFYWIEYYYKSGQLECEGLAEQKPNIWLIRRDLWKYYKKSGQFRYDINWKDSGIIVPDSIK